MSKSHLKQVGIRQNSRSELIVISVDVSAVTGGATKLTDGLLEGANYVKVRKNATGHYQFDLNRKARRTIVPIGGMTVAKVFPYMNSADSESFSILLTDHTGANSDNDFTFAIMCFYDDTQR